MSTRHTIYVRNSVQLFPKFDEQGQICQVVLQPNRYSNDTVFLGRILLKGSEIEEVLDVLAPQNTRGEKTQFWGFSLLLGQSSQTIYAYENVKIGLSNSIRFGRTSDKEDIPVTRETGTDKNTFGSAEVAVITWTKRQCSENDGK